MGLDKLPKAPLIHVSWRTGRRLRGAPLFFKNRLANAYRLQLWRLIILVRAPWLEHSARQMYPHLFGDHQ